VALLPLSAEESTYSASLKLHLGANAKAQDHLRPAYQNLGIDLGMKTKLGRVGAEFGWFYNTGDAFLAPIGQAPAGQVAVSTNNSGDWRRNQLSGLNVRLTLQRPLGASAFTWHGGLQVGKLRWTQQYYGDVSGGFKVAGPPAPSYSTDTWVWRETYSGTLTRSTVSLSPFAGLGWDFSQRGGFELNLMLLNYGTQSYVHVPGAASAYTPRLDWRGVATSPTAKHNDCPLDSTRSTRRLVPHLELTYVYHF
jgi:hypothetical protein